MTDKLSSLPIVIIGAGPAGLAAANALLSLGHRPLIVEKSDSPGGKLNRWHHLFPGFIKASDLKEQLLLPLVEASVEIKVNAGLQSIHQRQEKLEIILENGQTIEAGGAIFATGFTDFNADRKEEYGHGIYKNVFSSTEIEEMLAKNGKLSIENQTPKRIGLIHCVGSRDEKVNNNYCSKLCCLCGVKQAIEMKKLYPGADIYNFYMDLRMFGKGYEELYLEAQLDWKINFIRGRVSELGEDADKKIVLKTEDTLSGTPMKITMDFVILMVAMEGNKEFFGLEEKELASDETGFFIHRENFIQENITALPNVMVAGTCKGPLTVHEAMNDGKAAALALHEYLTSN